VREDVELAAVTHEPFSRADVSGHSGAVVDVVLERKNMAGCRGVAGLAV
jgi:hypothetical protein